MDFNLLYPYPPNVSAHGHQVDQLNNVIHVFMLVLFIGWAIFFFYCLVRFRARTGHKSQYELPHAKPSKYLEGFVVVFEAFLLLVLSMPAWSKVKNDFPTPDKNPLEVRVIAQQFAWNFHYAGKDGKFGKNDPKKGKAAAGDPIGLDRSGDGADDIVSAEFHFPVNRPVIARLTSVDVIHGFHMPLMRVQHDVMPGMEVKIWFEANKIPYEDVLPQIVESMISGNGRADTTATGDDVQLVAVGSSVRPRTAIIDPGPNGKIDSQPASGEEVFDPRGKTEIICAQLCGNSHFKMRGAVKIETAEEFEKWLASAVPEVFEEE